MDFERFTKVADIYCCRSLPNGNGSPDILTGRDMLRAMITKIQVVADISCDVDGPVACT